MGKIFLKLQCVADGMYLMPEYITDGQGENGLGVVSRVVERQYTFRHGMQRDKRFHIGLTPLLTDILPAVSRLSDMVRIEPVYIHIRQTTET